jgi:hypothetical protein
MAAINPADVIRENLEFRINNLELPPDFRLKVAVVLDLILKILNQHQIVSHHAARENG